MGGSDEEKEKERKRDIVGDFLKKNLNKGEIALKHAVGLGSQPNVVPVTQPVVDGPRRPVEVGMASLSAASPEKCIGAVLVGDYAHQLWMVSLSIRPLEMRFGAHVEQDENFDVIYTNAKIERDEWRTFPVGETRFNDDALRRAGESVIQSIRERQSHLQPHNEQLPDVRPPAPRRH
ncbi:hypothetical protein FOXG_05610 [Fusarium oxysporum f. sp. lycopersici 4287]|uniref:Uncharacterized protein n=1 Tax=Fusarium oxysporum f. sp. lycopersici (strain 4287 / CBS 123668 / FGSC 9935 / NRRL 34936) TaxID=426428 RepID=A0A0J9WL16_FUSO4|nr:hypothetical protein FOXG_05610 [Fusarium oxysporum f. sp. lycopersici 4287]KNB02997.1 hypothetical protein FOXG_05610 [Fusarium oxysporum f. sp. lycopersici 4287]